MQLAPQADEAAKPRLCKGDFRHGSPPDYFARVIQGKEVAVLRGNTCQPLRSRLRWLNTMRGLGVMRLRLRIADVVGHRNSLIRGLEFETAERWRSLAW